MTPSDPPGSGDLVRHLARFGRGLKSHGVGLTLSDEADALAALTLVDLGDREEVRLALRTALKIRPRDAAAFEALFARLWRDAASRSANPPNPPITAPRIPGPPRTGSRLPGKRGNGTEVEVDVVIGEEPGYSPAAVLRRKSFEECSPDDLAAMESLLARLRPAPRHPLPSRRRVPVRGAGETDLRRSFRRALAHGGEFLSLAKRARAVEAPAAGGAGGHQRLDGPPHPLPPHLRAGAPPGDPRRPCRRDLRLQHGAGAA